MTNQEILSAISNMLTPIREDIHDIKTDMVEVKQRLTNVENRLDNVEQRLTNVENDMVEVKQRLTNVENDMVEVKDRVTRIELTQENIILPRLNTIESCYTSTYDRYKTNIDDHEVMKQDIIILKQVVSEHSRILQKIS